MPRYSSWPHSSEHPRMERISWMAAVAGTAVSIVAYLVPSPLNLSLVASGPTTANHNTYLGVAVQGMVFFFLLCVGSRQSDRGIDRCWRRAQDRLCDGEYHEPNRRSWLPGMPLVVRAYCLEDRTPVVIKSR